MSVPERLIGFRAGPFSVILLLGLLLGGAGLATSAALGTAVVIPLASACLQACADNPTLMAIARGSAGLLIALIASGLVAGAVVLAGQLRETRRLVSRVESTSSAPPSRLAAIALELGLWDRLTYLIDPAPYAFCYGFLSPRICVSSGMAQTLSEQELRAVLLHEGFHMRQRDPLKVLVSRLVAGLLFLLPVAAELRDRYLIEKEWAADAHVVERLSPAPLATALLKLHRGEHPRPMESLATAAVGPFNEMSERILHLARPRESSSRIRAGRIAASAAVVAVLLLASAGSAFAANRSQPAGGSCCGTGTCSTSVDEDHFQYQ